MPESAGSESPVLARERHLKYWLRCLRSLLPGAYTSTDSSRMSLAFFALAALDLLDELNAKITLLDRQGYIDWIYQCQIPTGGFRGSPTHDLGEKRRDHNAAWDPATIPMTFFALNLLLILGDDFGRVKRRECLDWLRNVQHPNGSFGELLGEDGNPSGGSDPRLCSCASGVRYILRGKNPPTDLPDIDVEKLLLYIASCQTYDGGFSEGPMDESHAGFTYCAFAVLSLLDRIPSNPRNASLQVGMRKISFADSIHFLVARQTTQLTEEDEEDGNHSAAEDDASIRYPGLPSSQEVEPLEQPRVKGPVGLDIRPKDLRYAGFSGRVNKIADTCYCFWVGGSLAMVDSVDLIDQAALRGYLLEKTQHLVGGFAKSPGEPPDVLHSYLGLAALSITGGNGIERLNAKLCISAKAHDFMMTLPWWRGDRKTITIPIRSKQDQKVSASEHSYVAISGG